MSKVPQGVSVSTTLSHDVLNGTACNAPGGRQLPFPGPTRGVEPEGEATGFRGAASGSETMASPLSPVRVRVWPTEYPSLRGAPLSKSQSDFCRVPVSLRTAETVPLPAKPPVAGRDIWTLEPRNASK